MTFLTPEEVREIDAICAEIARQKFGRVTVIIEDGATKFLETVTTRRTPRRERPPPLRVADSLR